MTGFVLEQLTRPAYLRHPAWRWHLAMNSVLDKSMPAIYATDDPWLIQACRFYNALAARTSLLKLAAQFPVMYEAWSINMTAHPRGGLKWSLDAMLMTQEDDKTIADELVCTHQDKTVECFRKVFFDISEYKNNDYLLLSNVISIAMPSTDWTDCDYVYKMYARQHGLDMFRELIRFKIGGLLPSKIEEYLYIVIRLRRGWMQLLDVISLENEVRKDVRRVALAAGQQYNFSPELTKDDQRDAKIDASIGVLLMLDKQFKAAAAQGELPISRQSSEPCTVNGIRADADFRAQQAPKPL